MYQLGKTEANNQGLACSRLPATWNARMAASKDRAGDCDSCSTELTVHVQGPRFDSQPPHMHAQQGNGTGWGEPGKLGCSGIADNTVTLETEYS